MKIKKIIIVILTLFMLVPLTTIIAEEDGNLKEGLNVTINAIDNHIYQDTDNNKTDFRGDIVKYNSNLISFTYYNGDYEIAIDPDYIYVTEIGNTEKIIQDNLNLNKGDWEVTKTPHSLIYEFKYIDYDDDGSLNVIGSTKETLYVTVEEQLSLSEEYGRLVFDPLSISKSIVRLIGLNFTQYSTNENYFEYVCKSSKYENTHNNENDLGCGLSFSEYQDISDSFNKFIDVMFGAILGFAIILVIFRFVKSFFDSNPNQNNFRLANVIKKLGLLLVILTVMFNLDNIMLFIVHVFSVVTVSFYNLTDNLFSSVDNGVLDEIFDVLDSLGDNISLWEVMQGKVGFSKWILDLTFGTILNAVFFLISVIVLLKVALVVIERILIIILSVILAPIFVGYYLEPDRMKIATKFFSRFFASLFSALILLIVSIIFIFINEIFMTVIEITFYDLLLLEANQMITRIAVLGGYIMLMIFYMKTVTKADNISEELIVRNT